jgi:hypothetical protein
MNEHFKLIGDVAAGTVTVLTFVSVLPAVAAAFAIIWYMIGFYEKISGKAFSQSALACSIWRKKSD